MPQLFSALRVRGRHTVMKSALVDHISDRVAVMYMGRLVEVGPKRGLFAAPRHPYTEALMAAVPTMEVDHRHPAAPPVGEIPSPLDPPSGCRFRTRCPLATEICSRAEPPLFEAAPGHHIACHVRAS